MTKARSSFCTWSVPTRSPTGWSDAGVHVAGDPVTYWVTHAAPYAK